MIEVYKGNKMKPRGLRMLVYGEIGVGKTTLAATFPKPVFILASTRQGGDPTLQATDHDVIEVSSDEDMTDAINYIAQNKVKYGWETVVIDNLSHYAQRAIHILTNRKEAQRGKTGRGMSEIQPMRTPDWGLLQMHLKRVSLALEELDLHVIYIALKKDVYVDVADGRGGKSSTLDCYEPDIPGGAKREVTGNCDIVAHLDVIGSERKLQVLPGGKCKALRAPPGEWPVEVTPTFEELVKRLPWCRKVRADQKQPGNGSVQPSA